jgi:hypothetical protein
MNQSLDVVDQPLMLNSSILAYVLLHLHWVLTMFGAEFCRKLDLLMCEGDVIL